MHTSTHYDPDHYRFQRTQRLYTPRPEATEPLSGYGWELLRLAGIAALCGCVWLLCWVLA